VNTQVIESKEFKYHLIQQLKNISKLLESGDLFMTNNIINDPVQKILSSQKKDNWFDNIIVPMIESTAIDCEKSSPGSGRIFLNLALQYLPTCLRNGMITNEDDTTFELLKRKLESLSLGFCTESEFNDFIHENLKRSSGSLIMSILDIYSLGDHIEVKKTSLRETQIQKKTGFNFENVSFHPSFLKNGRWSRSQPKIVLFEGIIENAAEVHHILELSNKDKIPCALLCLGIKPEAHDVIIHNFMRETIDVVVGVIKNDEFNIQALVDLGTVCNTQPITAMTGETLSQRVARGLDHVDHIEITKAAMIINNESSKQSTDALFRDVVGRSQENPDLAYLFNKRIKTLSSSKIVVNIGLDDLSKDPNVVEEVDTFFRSCPFILEWGFVKKEDLQNFPIEIISLLFERTDVQPIHRVGKAISKFDSIKSQIERVGSVIAKDRS